ncbi:MAG: DUF2817 domain-containing protein [Proteobacteria bacterium]|nr:DUF2817 domain-containing protein [Pseudomonadota bacterium]
MPERSFLDYFCADYCAARERFRHECQRAGAFQAAIENPRLGPNNHTLSIDLAWFGPRDAERVLLVTSGTHGVEGLCGSGCQVGWIHEGAYADLPSGTAVLLVHTLNPYGVAWVQRETEEGIDLNRNFVVHPQGHRAAPLYAEIHEALLCPDLQGERYEAAQAVIAGFRERNGLEGYARALFGGQYDWPNGACYGGASPAWSNTAMREILQKHLAEVRYVTALDYHTGLGPYAFATPIVFCGRSHAIFARAQSWFGPAVMPVGSDDAPPLVLGHTGGMCAEAMPHAVVTPVTVEFGTYDMERECRVITRDLWLKNHGTRESELGRQIKADLLEYFYPADPDWREMVWHRSQQVMRSALDGLATQGRS